MSETRRRSVPSRRSVEGSEGQRTPPYLSLVDPGDAPIRINGYLAYYSSERGVLQGGQLQAYCG